MDDTLVKKIKDAQTNGMVCITLDIHLWSGRKRLRKDALISKNPGLADLPPESLATMGSIKIADPDDLAPFQKYKREAEKLLRTNGLPLLGTIGIPESKLEKVYKGLKEIQLRFVQKADDLRRDFDVRIDEWRAKPENAGWTHLINDIPTPEYVAGRLSFGFHLCRVRSPSDANQAINQEFDNQMTGLRKELFDEAASEANTLLTKYLMGRDENGVVRKREKITQKTIGPLYRIAEKFKSFGFLDPSAEPIAEMVNHVLSLVPKDGPIEGVNLLHIWTLAEVLSDPKKATDAAAMVVSKQSPGEAFEALLPEISIVDSPVETKPSTKAVPSNMEPKEDLSQDLTVDIPAAHETNRSDSDFSPSFVGLF